MQVEFLINLACDLLCCLEFCRCVLPGSNVYKFDPQPTSLLGFEGVTLTSWQCQVVAPSIKMSHMERSKCQKNERGTNGS